MRYSLSDVKRIYDFFDRDFFSRKLGKRLGKCKLTIDAEEAESWFGKCDFDSISGMSLYSGKTHLMYLNRYLLDCLKNLSNTILHEMIHLYDQRENPSIRDYRNGHGAFWTKIAALANERYERRLGKIERFSTEQEVEKMDRSKMIHGTKSLSNAYVAVLEDGLRVPVKTLNALQIEWLRHSSGCCELYRVNPGLPRVRKNRARKIVSFNDLQSILDGSMTYSEKLEIELERAAVRIFMNKL